MGYRIVFIMGLRSLLHINIILSMAFFICLVNKRLRSRDKFITGETCVAQTVKWLGTFLKAAKQTNKDRTSLYPVAEIPRFIFDESSVYTMPFKTLRTSENITQN